MFPQIKLMHTLCLLLAMTASVALAQTTPEGRFTTSQLGAYLEAPPAPGNGTQVMMGKAPGMLGQYVLGLKAVKNLKLKPMAVEPNTKYSLKMRARYDGSESIEENPLFESFLSYSPRTTLVPLREIVFMDAQGKRLSSLVTGMAFRQWHEYNDVFYTPPDTAAISVSLSSGIDEIVCFVDGVSLAKVEGEAAINISPVVNQLGRYNYSGWRTLGSGATRVTIDGKVYFNPEYGSVTERMPLSEPGEYRIVAQSTSNGYASSIELSMFDAQGKKTGQVNVGTGAKDVSFMLPAGTVSASFLVRSVLLEELHLLRVEPSRK